MHKAVMWGRLDLVNLLLQYGAHPDSPIGHPLNDNTPLMVGLCQKEREGVNIRPILKALLKAGAEPDVQNSIGQSANTLEKALIDALKLEIAEEMGNKQ